MLTYLALNVHIVDLSSMEMFTCSAWNVDFTSMECVER